MKTPWRSLMYRELSMLALDGRILDLGGSKGAEYQNLFLGNHSFVSANINEKNGYDIYCNVENSFPIEDASYDGAIAINLIEHVYNYQNVFSESYRVIKPGGVFVVAVPFLVQVHPCPHDFWRFSGEALARIMRDAGFKKVEVREIGRGPWTAAAQVTFNARGIMVLRGLGIFAGMFGDAVVGFLDRKRLFTAKRYPLGYIVIAER